VVDPSKKVPDLKCEVPDLLLEVVDLKREVPDLRSGGIPLNLTPVNNSTVQLHTLSTFAEKCYVKTDIGPSLLTLLAGKCLRLSSVCVVSMFFLVLKCVHYKSFVFLC